MTAVSCVQLFRTSDPSVVKLKQPFPIFMDVVDGVRRAMRVVLTAPGAPKDQNQTDLVVQVRFAAARQSRVYFRFRVKVSG